MTIRNKTITYAEKDLGVHAVYAEAQAIELELMGPEGLLAKRTAEADAVRQLELDIDNWLTRIRVDERGLNSDMSSTAFEAHLKVVIGSNEEYLGMRKGLNEGKATLDRLDGEIREKELAHRSRVARMNVLGGYLQYLASAKNAHTQARANATDWPY